MKEFKIELEDDERIVPVPIQPYENYYRISSKGRVWSLYKGRWMKPQVTRDGYLRVDLSYNGVEEHFQIHRLVAIAYIPNPENKPTVNHKNHNRSDNRVENLEWATEEEQHDANWLELNSKKVYCFETNEEYYSMNEAERRTGVRRIRISEHIRGLRPDAGGLHFKLV